MPNVTNHRVMRNVYLHGSLGERFGKVHRLCVATAAQAIRLLGINRQADGFLEAIAAGNWEIVVGAPDPATGTWLEAEDVRPFKLGRADLHIIPSIHGSADTGGVIKAVLGVVLVGTAIFASGGTLAGLGAPIFGSFTAGNLAMIGVAIGIAGVAKLLSKPDKSKKESSYALTAPNTYEQGIAVPLVYGETMTGSVVISVGYDTTPLPEDYDPSAEGTVIGTYNPETGQGVVIGDPSQYTSPSVPYIPPPT